MKQWDKWEKKPTPKMNDREHGFTFMRDPNARKKKVAIICQYSGTTYRGSTWQKVENLNNTIEKELVHAIIKAGGIQKDISILQVLDGELQKLKFQRGSRTDKGVSACCAVFSGMFCIIGGLEEFKNKINGFLPDDIHVLLVKRTLKSFCSYKSVDSRVYEYLCPSFVFDKQAKSKQGYRIDESKKSAIEKCLSYYPGTRDFWNFTNGVAFQSGGSTRYMKEIKLQEVFVEDGEEYVRFVFFGQSFMKHQIRKMLGLCVQCVRGIFEIEPTYKKVFGPKLVPIMEIPGEGLLLVHPVYDGYNQKCEKVGKEEMKLKIPELLDEAKRFKIEKIYPNIYKRLSVFEDYVERLQNFDPLKYAESPSTTKPLADI